MSRLRLAPRSASWAGLRPSAPAAKCTLATFAATTPASTSPGASVVSALAASHAPQGRRPGPVRAHDPSAVVLGRGIQHLRRDGKRRYPLVLSVLPSCQ